MNAAFRFAPLAVVLLMATTTLGQIIPGDPSTYPSETIINTAHNLNNYPGVTLPGNQICLACHTPHNALKSGHENVLWNHEETGQTFTMYFQGAQQPEGRSKMCLSCHDGVTAIDNYGIPSTGQMSGGTTVMTGPNALGTDLSNDHPIGIEYPSDPNQYNDPGMFTGGVGGQPGVQLVEVNNVLQVECTSCHNVHNNGLGRFLRVPLQESYLCLQCHIK